MFSTKSEATNRQFDIIHERNVAIPVRAGFTIDCEASWPDTAETFIANLFLFPLCRKGHFKWVMPVALCPERISARRRDCNSCARHGCAQMFGYLH